MPKQEAISCLFNPIPFDCAFKLRVCKRHEHLREDSFTNYRHESSICAYGLKKHRCFKPAWLAATFAVYVAIIAVVYVNSRTTTRPVASPVILWWRRGRMIRPSIIILPGSVSARRPVIGVVIPVSVVRAVMVVIHWPITPCGAMVNDGGGWASSSIVWNDRDYRNCGDIPRTCAAVIAAPITISATHTKPEPKAIWISWTWE